MADHLPPLPAGKRDYARLGFHAHHLGGSDEGLYETFLLVIDRGEVEQLPLMRHFDLYRLILDKLSSGRYCSLKTCDYGAVPLEREAYLRDYATVLGMAVRPRGARGP